MTDLNYKPLIKEKIAEFFEQNPNYSFGELMYSVASSLPNKDVKTKADFLNVTDEDFYTGIDKAIKKEENEG